MNGSSILIGQLMLLALCLQRFSSGKLRFTNIECDVLDPDFGKFAYCYIKSVNRTYQYMSIKVLLYKVPVDNVIIRGALFKRENGYRPYLYNLTLDGCKFLENTKGNIVIDYLFNCFKEFTNLNHTCPYDHDVYIEKLPTMHAEKMLSSRLIPFAGQYMLDTWWMSYGVTRGRVKVHINWE